MGLLSGVTIPWVDVSYRVGDRIEEVDGRGLSTVTTPGESPAYRWKAA